MEIFLVRHTTVKNCDNLCYGQSEVPLADTFQKEVEQIKNKIPIHCFDAVFSSPSERCTSLAAALNFNPIFFNHHLLELNFGDWEQKKWNDINSKELNLWMSDFVNRKPPNGEKLLELFHRVKLFFDDLRKENYNQVLIITHAGVIRCFLAYILEMPLKNIFKISIDYGQIVNAVLTKENFKDVLKINY